MRDLSISVHFVRATLRHAVAHGLDPTRLLRDNRIPPRLLKEDNARLSIERYADLQVSTMLAMQDEALGYASRRMPIGCWAMMCHAVIGSDNLGQALHRYCRFYQLFEFGAEPVLELQEDTACVRLRRASAEQPVESFLAEIMLFHTHRFASWLVQEHLPLQVVQLAFAAEAQAQDYRHMFLANPVEFEQEHTQLVMSRALLDKQVTQNEASLRHFLRHPVLILLTQNYAVNSWTTRVRHIVGRKLLDMPELNDIATDLDIHPQTLRRRLSAEGTTFKDIKNQVRRDTALHFLGKQGLSIEEIAHRAGFSESSAFIRAFKGWTGVTPYSYRKGL
ncbi:MAG: AraC family transcriptional regulator [Halioglobus sp.]|nr:AraC family transcriptional regulator [Halioglobus sp.]